MIRTAISTVAAMSFLAAVSVARSATPLQLSSDHLKMVFEEGEVLPGGAGDEIVWLNAVQNDSALRIGISGQIDPLDPRGFLWVDGDVVWEGTHPDEGLFTSRDFGFQTVSIAPSQPLPHFVHRTEVGIVSHNGVVLGIGDLAPGFDDGRFVLVSGTPRMVGGGKAYFWTQARIPGGQSQMVFYESPTASAGDIEIVLAPGQPLLSLDGGLTIDPRFGITEWYQVSNDDQQHVHVLRVQGLQGSNRPVVYRNGAVPHQWHGPVANRPGLRWTDFRTIVTNNSGTYAFYGRTDAPNDVDEVLAIGGNVVVTEGDVVDGKLLSSPGYPREISLANDGRLAFVWLTNGFGPEHLFITKTGGLSSTAGNIEHVLSAPSSMDLDGDGSADATLERFGDLPGIRPAFGADGALYAQVRFRRFGDVTHKRGILRIPL